MAKENDLLLNVLANPTFSISDFKNVGLNSTNTSLETEDAYKQHSAIKENPLFKKQNGEFDEVKFHQYYQGAQSYMNYMADESFIDDFTKQTTYHRDNIFAPVEQRRKGPDFSYVKLPNPDRTSNSIIRLGKQQESKQSKSEIAQSQKVLVNPTEATRADGTIDPEKAKWEDAPGEGIFTSQFWRNFGKTRVLAQWDESGEHIDPITGETKQHEKGELKLNDNGTYYYEDLDGRDVYGRQVLNKMDILTAENSEWNKYDFFDSDDKKEKSVFGTAMKNLALVGSMYIPYIGPAIAGLSVVTQTAGLFATLGKMLTGSDSPTLSAVEGWTKSVNRQGNKTEYAQQHNWCWENFIGLIGDTMAQFKEQRVLFEYAPMLFKGTKGLSDKNIKAYEKELLEKYNSTNQEKISKLLSDPTKINSKDIANVHKRFQELSAINNLKAQADVESYIKSYNKIGEILAKSYMTGVTVGDTYGEAKEQGASDIEATLLTLGYGAAEGALLNTGLGEWLFPELRYNKMHQEAVARALVAAKEETRVLESELAKKAIGEAEKEVKKNYVKKLFNIGKNTAQDLWTASKSTGKRTLENALANASGEGFEEVSEELLADFSKGCFNVVSWLRNDDTKLNAFDTDWKNGGSTNWGAMFDRYSMNFLGGFIGGGLSGLSLDQTRAIKNLNNISFNQGMQELIYMQRNGQIDEFLKTVNKMTLGRKDLSATKYTTLEDGSVVYEAGTAENNQDLAAKQSIKAQVTLLDSILSSNGMKISDASFLKGMTKVQDDLKYAFLSNSKTAGRFLQEYNTLCAKIIDKTVELNGTISDKTDKEKREETKEDKVETQRILNKDKLKEELQDLLKQKDEMLEGKRNSEFIQDALFELTPAISDKFVKPSFIRYAEYIEGKSFEMIPTDRRSVLQEQYKNYLETESAEDIHIASEIYRQMIGTASEVLRNQEKAYIQSSKNNIVSSINEFFKKGSYERVEQKMQGNDDAEQYIQTAQESEDKSFLYFGDFINKFLNNNRETERQNLLQQRIATLQDDTIDQATKQVILSDIDKDLTQLFIDNIVENIDEIVDPYLEQGYINSEVKLGLKEALQNVINNLSGNRNKLLNQINNIKLQFPMWDIHPELIPTDKKNEVEQLTEQASVFQNKQIELLNKQRQLDTLSHSPIQESLNQFALATTGENFNITEILDKVNTSLSDKRHELNNFNLEKPVIDQLDEAIRLIELYKLAIEGSKTDEGDADNLFGYTKTLNEVNKKLGNDSWEELAEINSEVANIFIQDADSLLNKLKYAKTLYAINQGQKLNQQKRVSNNKNYLFFKKMQKLITVIPDDWDKKQELKAALDNLTLLKQHSDDKQLTLSDQEQKELDKEVLKLEDLVYDFFNAEGNKECLTNPKKLQELLSASKLDLYSMPTGILNEETSESNIDEDGKFINNNLDDNSFVWWLATRAAVKASSFYSRYAQIINTDPLSDSPIAPIPTQELATYTNYASIINGGVFGTFFDAFRGAIKEDWKNKTADERTTILKELDRILLSPQSNQSFVPYVDTKYDDYILTILPTLKHKNITFTEGIPGSGKSTGVYKSTVKLLTTFHADDHILDNVIVVHGASLESARGKLNSETGKYEGGMIDNLGLDRDKTKAMSYQDFMKHISNDWIPLDEKDSEGNYTINSEHITINEEGEVISTNKINEYQPNDRASLIIIDEVTNFTTFDLQDIDAYASRYGIAVLAAGDTDQSGISGKYTLTEGMKAPTDLRGDVNYITLLPVNFIRTPKLGVSMRTANSQKSYNLKAVQAYLQNPNGKIDLRYCENEQGLFGDKLFLYNTDIYSGDYDTGTMGEDCVDDSSELMETINRMIETLKPGEKIGYIYDNINSPLYKKLTENYSEYITLYEGTSAQGKEGQYFIIELNEDRDTYPKDFYTSITRAEQGSLIISDALKTFSENINPLEESSTMLEGLDKRAILRYSEQRKESLIENTQNAPDIVYKKRPEKLITTVANPNPTSTNAIEPPVINLGNPNSGSEQFDPNDRQPNPEPPSEESAESFSTDGLNVPPEEELPQPTDEELANLFNFTNEENPSVEESPNPEEESSEFSQEELNEMMNAFCPVGEYFYVYNESGEVESKVLMLPPNIITIGSLKGKIACHYQREDGSRVTIHFDTLRSNFISGKYSILPPVQNVEQIDENIIYGSPEEEVLGRDLTPTKDREEEISLISQLQAPAITTTNGEDNEGSLKMEMPFYTFNTFECGVDKDNRGMPIQRSNNEGVNKRRTDNVNGLLNLDRKLNTGKNRTVDEYLNILGEIRKVLIDYDNLKDIQSNLTDIMFDYFGTSNITCKFGFLSTVPSVTHEDNDFATFQRDEINDVQYIYSKGSRSKEINKKHIVATLGTSELGDILTVPILTLSNPISIILSKDSLGNYRYPDIAPLWANQSDKIDTNIRIDTLLKQAKEKGIDKKYKTLLKLFQVYRDITSEAYFLLQKGEDEKDWTPASHLRCDGPQIIPNIKGSLIEAEGVYEREGFEYNADFINISEFAKNPQVTITPILYNPNADGTIQNGDENISISKLVHLQDGTTKEEITTNIIHRGHPFVLFSYHDSIGSHNIYTEFINQLANPNAPKKVGMAYVLPPKASIADYIYSLRMVLTGNKAKALDIGNSFTAFNLLTYLFKNPDFKKNIIINRHDETLSFIESCVEEIKNATTPSEQYKILISTKKGGERLGYHGSVREIFRKFLCSLVYPSQKGTVKKTEFIEDNLNLIVTILNSAGIDGVFFNASGDRSNVRPVHNQFVEIKQSKDNDGMPQWGIVDIEGNFRPYKIHGKIDSPVFKADPSEILDIVLKHMVDNKHLDPRWDGQQPKQGPYKEQLAFAQGRITLNPTTNVTSTYIGASETTTKLPNLTKIHGQLNKLGITDYSEIDSAQTIEEQYKIIDKFIIDYNKHNKDKIAFAYEDYIFITDTMNLPGGPFTLMDFGESDIFSDTVVRFKKNSDNQLYFSMHNQSGNTFDCIYSKGILNITPKGIPSSPIQFTIDDSNIETIISDITKSQIENHPRYNTLAQVKDLNELTNLLNEWIQTGSIPNPETFKKVLIKKGIDEITATQLQQFIEELMDKRNSTEDNCSIQSFNIKVR